LCKVVKKTWLRFKNYGKIYIIEFRKGGAFMLVNSDKKWDYALGIIKVDGLEPTPEFKRLIEKEKRGEMTMEDIKKTLDKKYKMKE